MALVRDERAQDSACPTRNRLSRNRRSPRTVQSSSSLSEHAASLRSDGVAGAEAQERKNADSGLDTHRQPTPGPQKRRRRLTTADFTRPKRASTACLFCRVRKAKCDNARPICGFCLQHSARCFYPDDGGGPVLPPQTHSEVSGDPGVMNEQRRILERLDELKQMVLQTQQLIPTLPLNPSLGATSPEAPTVNAWNTASHVELQTSIGTPLRQTEEFREHSLHRSSTYYTALFSESILRWPIFRDVLPEEHINIDSFVFKTNEIKDFDAESAEPSSRGIRDNDFVPLCQKFLKYAHARNPILDGGELLRDAQMAAEDGLKWDSASCLVLLACAIATYTAPWVYPDHIPENADEVQLPTVPGHEDHLEAETYYIAAKKRLGFLGSGIRDIQCLFFASVYEKYRLHALQAWLYIQQASSKIQARLLCHASQRPWPSGESAFSRQHHLEQRVFWSCFKAESELLVEIPGLRSSGLEAVSYPDSFPVPPAALTMSNQSSTFVPYSNQNGEQQQSEEERSWFFYFAEISLRRLINDTLQHYYAREERHWTQNTSQIIHQYREIVKGFSLWYSHLPPSIQFDEIAYPDNELVFFLQDHFQDWHERISRPILYHAIHWQASPSGNNSTTEATKLAQHAISIISNTLVRSAFHPRHGGIWFATRRAFTSGMLILAVVLSPGPPSPASSLVPPSNWQSLIRLALRILSQWEGEAADVKLMRTILERAFHNTCKHIERFASGPA